MNRQLYLPAVSLRPVAYVPQLAEKLDLSPDQGHLAEALTEQGTDAWGGWGQKPTAMAANYVYTAAHRRLDLTHDLVAEAADDTAAAIRKRLNEFLKCA